MLFSVLLQAAAGVGLSKVGAALGAGLAVIGAGIGIYFATKSSSNDTSAAAVDGNSVPQKALNSSDSHNLNKDGSEVMATKPIRSQVESIKNEH